MNPRPASAWRRALANVEANYPSCERIHLLAAVPVVAAVASGQHHMRDAQPQLVVYQRTAEEYVEALRVGLRCALNQPFPGLVLPRRSCPTPSGVSTQDGEPCTEFSRNHCASSNTVPRDKRPESGMHARGSLVLADQFAEALGEVDLWVVL
ncbi:hypothetical protein [Microbacterium trichothecenolyticum]|uniref:hypothetical protein n=1 Tax=Microbacterium trichothecenolyticum TaxID=69370 RepID=UPI003CCBCD29